MIEVFTLKMFKLENPECLYYMTLEYLQTIIDVRKDSFFISCYHNQTGNVFTVQMPEDICFKFDENHFTKNYIAGVIACENK